MRRDGSVVSWGAPKHGGDCSAVQGRLSDVQQIQASGGDKLKYFLFVYKRSMTIKIIVGVLLCSRVQGFH